MGENPYAGKLWLSSNKLENNNFLIYCTPKGLASKSLGLVAKQDDRVCLDNKGDPRIEK